MRNLLLSIVAASSIASAAHAGIGETYRESNRHYRSTGEWEGDHANWHYREYLLTEGFDSRGFCNIILIAHTDRSNLTTYEVTTLLRDFLPVGYTWRAYNGNPNAPTWGFSFRGVQRYAMYYTNVGTTYGASTAYFKCLRIATEGALVSRGLMKGPAPRRFAGDVSRSAHRKAQARSSAPKRVEPQPELTISDI
jgi:hypothetical protein